MGLAPGNLETGNLETETWRQTERFPKAPLLGDEIQVRLPLVVTLLRRPATVFRSQTPA